MSIVILDAMEDKNRISDSLKDIALKIDEKLSYFELRSKTIQHCRACDACGYKSPGRCVFDDDMHEIHRAMAGSSTIILLTPIRFGGYPSRLKKAVDKFMHMCLPSYGVWNGHLVHPARYGSKTLLGIGVQCGGSKDREESFRKLVGNNALNLQFEYKAIALNSSEAPETINRGIADLLWEVYRG